MPVRWGVREGGPSLAKKRRLCRLDSSTDGGRCWVDIVRSEWSLHASVDGHENSSSALKEGVWTRPRREKSLMTIVMRLTKAMKSGSQGMRSFLAAGFARTATRRRVSAAAAVNRPNLKKSRSARKARHKPRSPGLFT